MGEIDQAPIIAKPLFNYDESGDGDPSGGWGLVLLLAILAAVVAAYIWLTFIR